MEPDVGAGSHSTAVRGMLNQFSLEGRGVVLTGAAGHLGRAMSAALLDAGATVVAVGRTAETLNDLHEDSGGNRRLLPLAADATERAVVERAADLLGDAGLPLSGWVNNAFAGRATQLGDLDPEALRESIEAGLTSVIEISDLVAARMRSAEGGSILNVASMYGLVSPQPAAYAGAEEMHNPPAYGAAKAGLIQFTRYAAVHWAGAGVRVNALTPGAFPAGPAQRNEDFIAELERRVPLGRIGRPEEVGGAVVFLLSDASSYMTGQQLIVDGGWTAW